MSDRGATKGKPWCIVVADDHGPEYVPWMAGAAKTSPVQYCDFGEPTTFPLMGFTFATLGFRLRMIDAHHFTRYDAHINRLEVSCRVVTIQSLNVRRT
jgi:hypothetical protein